MLILILEKFIENKGKRLMKKVVAFTILMLIILTGCTDRSVVIASEEADIANLESSSAIESSSAVISSSIEDPSFSKSALDNTALPDWITDEKVNGIVKAFDEYYLAKQIGQNYIFFLCFALADIDGDKVPEFFCGNQNSMMGASNCDVQYLGFSLSDLNPIRVKNVGRKSTGETIYWEDSDLYFFTLKDADLFDNVYYLNSNERPYYMILSQYIYEYEQGEEVRMETITYTGHEYVMDMIDYPNTSQAYPMATATVEVDKDNTKESILQCIKLYEERKEALCIGSYSIISSNTSYS